MVTISTKVVHVALALLLGSVPAGKANSADREDVKRNPKFLIDISQTLAFDTAVAPIGPFRSQIASGTSETRWTQKIVAPKTVSSMALHFTITQTQAFKWQLLIKSAGTVQDTIDSESPRGKSPDVWSSTVAGNVVEVELIAQTAPKGLSVVVDQYDYAIQATIPQGIIGENEMQSIRAVPSDIRQLGTAVGRLRIKTSRGQALCTGFLVSDDLMITNYHCIPTTTTAVNTQVDFGYDRIDRHPSTYRVQNLTAVNSDLAYDYAIISISGHPGKTFSHIKMPSVGSSELPMDMPPLGTLSFSSIGKYLILIEHPGGGPQQVSSSKKCAVAVDKITGVDPEMLSDFAHTCDTLGGSSGSPVFASDSKALVGLHHLGYEDSRTPDKTLVNQAVYIGYVLEDLRKKSPGVLAQLDFSRANGSKIVGMHHKLAAMSLNTGRIRCLHGEYDASQ